MAGVNSEYRQAIGRLLSLVDAERNRITGPRQKAIYNLERMERFAERLGSPHRRVPALHIAGTKGKGSTAAMGEAALRAAGYSTGFYSSPHLHTFRERLRRNGQPVSESVFARLVAELWPLRQPGPPGAPATPDGQPAAANPVDPARLSTPGGPVDPEGPAEATTLFEFLTGMAFCCFADDAVDLQVIEVGLGGRLDATNVLDAAVAVITSVSLDHTQVLGDTVGEIAADKAGIIKPGAVAVIAPQSPEALAPLLAACERVDARPILVGRDVIWEPQPPAGNPPSPGNLRRQGLRVYGLRHTYELELPLLGEYQQENAATAVAALEAVAEAQGFEVPPEAVAAGLAAVSWPCRMEVLAERPLVVADGAHNPYSVDSLLRSLPDSLPHRRLLVVAGFSRDKNVAEMAGSLAAAASGPVFAAASRHPRSLPPDELAQLFRQYGAEAIPAATPAQALAMARSQATEDDLILATGSLFLAAEVREAALGLEPEVYPELLTGAGPSI